ncbi:MAG: hypothetical protein HW387_950 [Parachlamydiales bacterium]|nr:hypothetical protein [Parachlamydiales bacterium]
MKKYFITGLVTLLPFAVTVMSVIFVVNLLTQPFMGIVTHPLSLLPIGSEKLIRTISQLLILVFLFFFTLGIGMVAQRFFFKALMKLGDRIVSKIPIVRKVYKTTKEIFQTLFASDKKSFEQVVMFPFPRKGSYVLGLISRNAPETCSKAGSNPDMITIFVPATPNPTSGFLIMRPRQDLIYLDMRSEDALKYVVSCGVVPPEPAKEIEP